MSTRPQFSSPLVRGHVGQEQQQKKKKPNERDPNHQRNEAKRARLEAEEEEEKRLTSLLFGGDANAPAWNDDDDDDGDEEEEESVQDNSGALFQIDRKGVGVDSDSDDGDHDEANGQDEDDDDEDDESSLEKGQTSAWVDDDDENITVSLTKSDRIKKLRTSMAEDEIQASTYEKRLRDRFQATASATSRTDWATLPESEDEASGSDSDDEFTASKLLSSTAPLLSNTRLQPNILSVVRCADANVGHYNNSTVQAVQFHAGSDEDEPLMLTAGLDKTLRFFKINGTEGSEKVHGIHFPNLPIHNAAFLGDTGSVVVSGRRPFFYIYDAVAGKVSLLVLFVQFCV